MESMMFYIAAGTLIATLVGIIVVVFTLIKSRTDRSTDSNSQNDQSYALREILRQQSMDFVRINQGVNDQLHTIITMLYELIKSQDDDNNMSREEHSEIRKLINLLRK